jgi:hypothetical protein
MGGEITHRIKPGRYETLHRASHLSKKMGKCGHDILMKEVRNAYIILVRNLKEDSSRKILEQMGGYY